MLHFFRRYQKIVFYIVTCVIICSFVFFGTYQAFGPQVRQEKQAIIYVTKQGKKIGSRYFNQLCQFLGVEDVTNADLFAGNFLSDQLVSNEFLQTNLALDIILAETQRYEADLDERLQKEKHYIPYVHPTNKQLSAQSLWELFAPDILSELQTLQQADSGVSALKAKIALYNSQRRFPPQFLANMLRYQERTEEGSFPDPRLAKGAVQLFGYDNLEDWFGRQFIERIAQLVIETVGLAKEKGYHVCRQEAVSEMLYKSQRAYEALREYVDLPANFDCHTLLQLFMRYGGYDEKTLTDIYQDLLLFKRFINDASTNVVLDPLPFETFYAKAGEAFTVEIKQMPSEFYFHTVEQLKDFECYLAALNGTVQDALLLPSQITPHEALLADRYELYVAQIDINKLALKATVKQTWEWQSTHLEMLCQKFPYLKRLEGTGISILDQLEPAQKQTIDHFSRQQIVAEHPEWVEEAVCAANIEYVDLSLARYKPRCSLEGISDIQAFKQVLDHQDEVVGYTQDGMHVYRIVVQERHPNQLISFKQALETGVLATLHEEVNSDQRVQTVLQALQEMLKLQGKQLSDEEAVAYRFYQHLMSSEEPLEVFSSIQQYKTIDRTQEDLLSYEQVCLQNRGDKVDGKEGLFIYQVVDQIADTSVPLEKMVQANQLLGQEIRQQFLKQIIEQLHV